MLDTSNQHLQSGETMGEKTLNIQSDAPETASQPTWSEKNPERVKEINRRYLEKNRELVLLRQRRTWLFSKKGRGIDVSDELLEVESRIDFLVKERDSNKNS